MHQATLVAKGREVQGMSADKAVQLLQKMIEVMLLDTQPRCAQIYCFHLLSRHCAEAGGQLVCAPARHRTGCRTGVPAGCCTPRPCQQLHTALLSANSLNMVDVVCMQLESCRPRTYP